MKSTGALLAPTLQTYLSWTHVKALEGLLG